MRKNVNKPREYPRIVMLPMATGNRDRRRKNNYDIALDGWIQTAIDNEWIVTYIPPINWVKVPDSAASITISNSDPGGPFWDDHRMPNVEVYGDTGDGFIREYAVEILLNGIVPPDGNTLTSVTVNFSGPIPGDTYVVLS